MEEGDGVGEPRHARIVARHVKQSAARRPRGRLAEDRGIVALGRPGDSKPSR